MSNLWKEVTSWLSDATRSAIKETEGLARKGHLKLEILGINTALHDKFAALGGIVYELMKNKKDSAIGSDTQVTKLALEIAGLETQLRAKKSKGKKVSASQKQTVSKKQTGKKQATRPSSKKATTTKKKPQKSAAKKTQAPKTATKKKVASTSRTSTAKKK